MSARVIEISGDSLPIPAVEEAGAVLAAGGLVVMPTDTVYGLCCRAGHTDAVSRAFAAKGRPADKPMPFLLPGADAVPVFVNRVVPVAQRLMDGFWPGALTLVMGPGEGIALRVPDHPLARAVIEAAGVPVHGTSANRSGEPEAMSGAEARAALGAEVDLILDAGPVPSSPPSAVVRVPDEGPLRVLREGAVSGAELNRVGLFRVAVVCTGNTCRSPMAAALLCHLLAGRFGTTIEQLPAACGIEVVSAGVMAWAGSPMTPEADRALRAAGVPVPDHGSRLWDAQLAATVDRVLVMTPSHLAAVTELVPELAERVALLDLGGGAIDDPIGGDLAVYQGCLEQMGIHLRGWIERWLG